MKILRLIGLLVLLQWDFSCAANNFPRLQEKSAIIEGCKNLENTTPMLRLKRYLFCEYDSNVRPVLSHQTVTNVTMKLFPMLLEFDEYSSTMGLHSWMILTWTDWHLTWTPSDYDGILSLHVKSDDLWTPDLSVYNSGDISLDQNGFPSTTCLVFSSGTVTCVPPTKHTVKCYTDFALWPYDKHKCKITFGSWSHSGEEVNFHLDKSGYQMDNFVNNTQWDLKLTDARKILQKFECCPNETYPTIIYDFELTRHFGTMHATFVTPAITLMLLTMTVLWLDSRSTERIGMASVNFICHLICIFDLHWQLPHNGANPPNILLFYRDSLALAAFALVLTALLRKIQDMNIEVPYWISSTTTFVLSNRAARFLILSDDEESKFSNTGILADENEENTDVPNSRGATQPRDRSEPRARGNDSSWRHFASIIEWLSFFFVAFVYIVIMITLVPSA